MTPRALIMTPDVAHIQVASRAAITAAATAVHLLILNDGDRIFQRELIAAPRSAPVTLAATSTAEGSRCIITNWLVSANVDIKGAVNTAPKGPNPSSTAPTGT